MHTHPGGNGPPMRFRITLLLLVLGSAGLRAQSQVWQPVIVTWLDMGFASLEAQVVSSPPVFGTASSQNAPVVPAWSGALASAQTGTKLGSASDGAGNAYTLFNSSTAPANPLGFVSQTTAAGTQFFGLGFTPQLLGVSPSGSVFIMDSTGLVYQLNPTGGATTPLPVTGAIVATSSVFGGTINGPMTVDADDNISVPVLFQSEDPFQPSAATAPGEFLFLTTGPIPYAWPLAAGYANGSTVTLLATSALPISYQWSFGGLPIAGATTSTLVSSVAGTYTVTATTAAGSVTSSATLQPLTATLTNLSCRAYVGTNASIAIAGFTVTGQAGTSVQALIRGVGPTLSQFSMTGVLSRPVLSLFDSTGKLLASNTGWGTGSNASLIVNASWVAGAFALPSGSADSALLMTLSPGSYTAQVSGLNNTSGIALIEVYAVPFVEQTPPTPTTPPPMGTPGSGAD